MNLVGWKYMPLCSGNHVMLCSGDAVCSGIGSFTEIAVFLDLATQVGRAVVLGVPLVNPTFSRQCCFNAHADSFSWCVLAPSVLGVPSLSLYQWDLEASELSLGLISFRRQALEGEPSWLPWWQGAITPVPFPSSLCPVIMEELLRLERI